MRTTRRRVAVVGLGAVTPLGHSAKELYDNAIRGVSGVGPITRFDATALPTTFASEVKGFELSRFVSNPERWKHSGVAAKFLAAATQEALGQAGLIEGDEDSRAEFGLYLGTGEATQELQALVGLIGLCYRADSDELDPVEVGRRGTGHFTARTQHEQELHTVGAHLAEHFRLDGPNASCLTACAAGSQAIGEAAELIRSGDATVMVAGGAHGMVYPLGVTGFALLTALSKRNDAPQKASRPFDRMRDGFVVGEGAGVLILEEMSHALDRGATILAEITGYGSTADAYRVTDSHPSGKGAAQCIRAALADAGLSPEAIGYINAHGTSTRVNDHAETLAIKAVFGDHARRVPISSTKSMTGHLIGAAGAVEAVLCVEAMRRGILPPTINYEVPDPDCDLDYIPNVARPARVNHILSNSFGFGGQNASLVLSRVSG